jgi:hypothetical protein
VPDAGEYLHRIGFDPLPAAAPIASLPPPQFDINRRGIDLDPGRKAIDDGQQRLAMRLAGGPIA